jgi:hypothetical protein
VRVEILLRGTKGQRKMEATREENKQVDEQELFAY